ncbi:alpha/beta fold hydrolase [Streptomyces californicus]|uniref:alpha/beta fold hydrolase n=1 Tax=Streptomyces californicus TaxID=67351 RepID=UPI0033F0A69F
MSTAQCLPLVAALARKHRVTVVDLPGQPGLSSDLRPRARRLVWYGAWLDEFLERAVLGPVVVVGHSLGGAIALAGDSPTLVGRVLLSSAGITRLRVPAPLLAATIPWLLRPSVPRAAKLLNQMSAPDQHPPADLCAWMDLVSRSCRSSLAPAPLPSDLLERRRSAPTVVATGRHDPFLPPHALGPAVRDRLGLELKVIEQAGHLVVDEATAEVAALVSAFCAGFGER